MSDKTEEWLAGAWDAVQIHDLKTSDAEIKLKKWEKGIKRAIVALEAEPQDGNEARRILLKLVGPID